jgi:uncharacterized membrane protein YkoI
MAAPILPSNMVTNIDLLRAESPQYEQFAQKKISASQAKSIARSRVPGGEIVDISLRNNTYRVRVIAKNGRVVDIYIDASTGRVK